MQQINEKILFLQKNRRKFENIKVIILKIFTSYMSTSCLKNVRKLD